MALPDYFKWGQGTPIIWGHTGGSGVTLAMDANNLANGSGRMGAYADLGALWDQEYQLHLWGETGTAPTAGNPLEAYLAWSYDATNWPGKVDGTNAAYPTTVAANKLQLGLPALILPATADANTVLKRNPVIIRAKTRYVAPVIINLFGQSLRNQGTPANNGTRLILVPNKSSIED